MDFTLIVTLGPAVLVEEKIKEIYQQGPCIFRINGAHANATQAASIAKQVRNWIPEAKIMIDLPGNKVRTANLVNPIRVNKGEKFVLTSTQFNYQEFYKFLKPGTQIFANDSIFEFEVVSADKDSVEMLSKSTGVLQTNKGMHVPGINKELPFLFERDQELIDMGIKESLDYISLSFVRNKTDVMEAKKLIGNNCEIIAKIETRDAVENLVDILGELDLVNVDRGDLSADIGTMQLPQAQEEIVQTAVAHKKNIFLATQFLKTMEVNPIPTIAELVDLHKTIQSGICGIQLSEETAVGNYPVECVKLVFDSLKKYKS